MAQMRVTVETNGLREQPKERRLGVGSPQRYERGSCYGLKSQEDFRMGDELPDINVNDMRIEGIMPRGDLRLYEENSPEKAYVVRRNELPDALKSFISKTKPLESRDAQSLPGIKVLDFVVKNIAVGGGGSISLLGRLRGADKLFVLSKTTFNRAFDKDDVETFWENNSKMLSDSLKRRDSYAKWREGLKLTGSIRRSKRLRELKANVEGSNE
ncbi:Nitrogen assimilation transcription factor nirA [Fusarium oxysporum f. sp. albedinis]|nr:UV-damage endonuclease [Fusarium oxysporum f. sp. albedinis]KAJ0130560.1 Nitrogen assimilation transcription factor nirA [Fusarium oxysporum f. sp. albedinis]